MPAIDLQARGIALEQAADLRARLAAFAEEWESPEMEIYDDYDAVSPRLPTPGSSSFSRTPSSC